MSGTTSQGGLRINLDMDKVHDMLKTQPRFTVTSTAAGRETTLIEALKKNPGELASDNQVNVLC